jgi:hypothetical protein
VPPRRVTGPEGAAYELDDGLAAVSQPDGRFSVVPAEGAGPGAGPVYRAAGAGGAIAVPTGRVFVRFGAGTRAQDRAGELEAAGFDVEDVPGFAPHAAWVRPRSGRVEDALEALDAVRGVPGVEHAEPQLVAERASRGDP